MTQVKPTWLQRAHLATFGLCGPCWDEMESWSDYRPVYPIRISNGAGYDDTMAGTRDRQRQKFEQWRDTCKFQMELIRDRCAREHRRPITTAHLPGEAVSEVAA